MPFCGNCSKIQVSTCCHKWMYSICGIPPEVTLISDATDLDGLIFVRQADTLLRPLFWGMEESTLYSSSNLGLKQSYRPIPKGKRKQNRQSLDKNIQAIKKFSDSWKLDFKEIWQAGGHLTQSATVVSQLGPQQSQAAL